MILTGRRHSESVCVCLIPLQYKQLSILSTVCVNSILLIEVSLGYGEEGAVSLSSDSEDEGLAREDGQVAHHLARVGDEQKGLVLTVDHALVNVERT